MASARRVRARAGQATGRVVDSAALRAMCRVPSNVTADQVSLALRGPWGDGKDFDGNPLENE